MCACDSKRGDRVGGKAMGMEVGIREKEERKRRWLDSEG